MARKRKPSGRLNKGPFTGPQIIHVLLGQGYVEVYGGNHRQFEHPDRPGKVSVTYSWTSVKYGSDVFESLADQSGFGKRDLLRLMNGLPL